MITRICQNCNKEYETFPSIRPKYCSQKCSGEGRRTGREIPCANCGKTFWQFAKSEQTYCSQSCAISARNKTDQNPAYHRDVSGSNNPMYGKRRSGKDNPMYGKRGDKSPRWTGGRRTRKDGYVFVLVPDDHPSPSYTNKSGAKYMLEHRFIMEQHLERFLLATEVVHHMDGNPSNNEIDNLRLYPNQSRHISDGHS